MRIYIIYENSIPIPVVSKYRYWLSYWVLDEKIDSPLLLAQPPKYEASLA